VKSITQWCQLKALETSFFQSLTDRSQELLIALCVFDILRAVSNYLILNDCHKPKF